MNEQPMIINSERLLKEAREQDHTCEFCYYVDFDDKAYPCSRCVCNQPTENMWRAKVEDEPQRYDKPPKCLGCFYSDLDKAFHPCASCVDFGKYIGEVSGKGDPQERSE